jgi:ribosomal-protein-serine acetyltransferase
VWVDGAFAGGAGLTVGEFAIAAEIGYWIRSAYAGRGLVTRAARVLTGIAFEEFGVHRVVIRAGVENVRSRAIPERLGFTLEGVARGEGRGSGGFYDLAVYAVLEDEWPTAEAAAMADG